MRHMVSKKAFKGVQVSEADYGSFMAIDMNRIEVGNPYPQGNDLITPVHFYGILARVLKNGNTFISEMEEETNFLGDLPSDEEMVKKVLTRSSLNLWDKHVELITYNHVDENGDPYISQETILPRHRFNYDELSRVLDQLENVRLNLPHIPAHHSGWWKYE